MVPTRLSATNFLSYATLDLDLTGLQAACIAGVNGSGKSSLVDALLYAWCGVGRYKLLDQYVRLGTDRMSVTLEWQVGQQRYRVIRRRSTAGRGKSESDLQIMGETGEWIGLASGEGVTSAVASILGLDHDSLVSSAICRQGDASRFTDATAGQRKAILRSIFRLGDYETLAKIARDRGAKEEARIEVLEPERARLGELAAGRAEAQRRRDAASEERSTANNDLDAHEKLLATIRDSLATLQAKLAQRLALIDEAEALRDRCQETEVRMETATADLEAARTQAARRQDLERLVKEADDLAEQIRMAEQVLAGRQAELREAQQAEGAGETRLAELTAQAAAMKTKLQEWRAMLAQAEEIEAAARETAEIEQRLTTQEEQLGHRQEQCRVIDHDLQSLARGEAELSRLTTQLDAARDRCTQHVEVIGQAAKERVIRAGLIEMVPCADVERSGAPLGATCPLLKEAWDARRSADEDQQHLAEAAQRLLNPDPALRAKIDEVSQGLSEGDREGWERDFRIEQEAIASLTASIRDDKATVKRLQPLAQLAGKIEVARAESTRLDTERQTKEREADGQTAVLAELRDTTQTAKQRCTDATEPLDLLKAELARQEDHRPTLDQAKAAEVSLPLLDRQLAELSIERERNAARERELNQQIAALGDCERQVAEVATERSRLEVSIDNLKGRALTATREQADAEALLSQIIAAESRLTEIMPTLDAARLLIRRYERLLAAYKTVPVLVLENVIPAIEAEANAVLSRISSSGLQVRLETLKAVKNKDTLSEDLEIIVRDRAGERPIEGYSGGEHFRVAFALRVSLSRVIAQRSGVGLDFLIVDEGGFGALDPEGLAQVLEAIHRIKDEFSLILIVSHLDSVLEGFASRIMVTKDGAGSHAEVLA